MPNQFRTGPGRRISDRYERRVKAVGRETIRLRTEVRRILKKALQNATQEELYDRTPLPVTEEMMKSIVTRTPKGEVIEVGYLKGKGAKHAKYRLNMTGTSVKGGHKLDMQPSVLVAKEANPKIDKAKKAAQKRILED